MYKTVKHVRQFDLDSEDDRSAYEEILNNPLAKIIEENQIKKTECEYGEEGQLASKVDRYVLVTKWEIKEPV